MPVKLIGVTSSIKDSEVGRLPDRLQDEVIAREAKRLEEELGKFVGGLQPKGDLVVDVTGPHNDPIQGIIHIHTVAGHFETDDLPLGCEARRVYLDDQLRNGETVITKEAQK